MKKVHYNPFPIPSPTPEQQRADRMALGWTQSKAAALLHVELRTYRRWEKGTVPMSPWFRELFLIKAGLHPVYGERLPKKEG